MYRQFLTNLATSSVAVLALALGPSQVFAQHHSGGGGHGSSGHGGGSHSGSWPGGAPHSGGYHSGYGWGYPYYRGYDYYPRYYGYWPRYYGYWGSGYPWYGYGSYGSYGPDYYDGSSYGYESNSAPSEELGDLAHIRVNVPADAQVWFDDQPTSQTGSVRYFDTPRLSSGREYSYEVRARWNENGRDVTQTRRVTVHAGESIAVDFTQPEEKVLPMPSPASKPGSQ